MTATYRTGASPFAPQVIARQRVIASCHKCYCLVPQMLLPRATQAIHANAVKILENRADNRNTKHLPKPHRIIVEYYIEKPHCLAAAVSVLPINNNMPQLKTTYGQQQDRRDQQLPPLIIIGKNSAPAHQDESNGGHYA